MHGRRWLFRNCAADRSRRDNGTPTTANAPSVVAAAQVEGGRGAQTMADGPLRRSPIALVHRYNAHLCTVCTRLLLCPADIFEHPVVVHLVCRRRPPASGGKSTAVFRNDHGSPPPPPETRTTVPPQRRYAKTVFPDLFSSTFVPPPLIHYQNFYPPAVIGLIIFLLRFTRRARRSVGNRKKSNFSPKLISRMSRAVWPSVFCRLVSYYRWISIKLIKHF